MITAGAAKVLFGSGEVAEGGGDVERDRQTILAMRGEYKVDFNFEETAILSPGYERAPDKHTGGYETVVELESTPTRIVLQHILVGRNTGRVTKHWRQEWEYEVPRRFEFSADQTWTLREIPESVTRGAWTQTVYEVSDAPRYCGTARWTYEGDIPTWTSDPSPRPLPRREYSTRHDYDVLVAINRHSIVPGGWTHEQDNTKARRGPDGRLSPLVREYGFNNYARVGDGMSEAFDFSPAYDYWHETGDFWARVRGEWATRMAAGSGIHLNTRVDGMQLIRPLAGLAARAARDEAISDTEIVSLFDQWVAAPEGASATNER